MSLEAARFDGDANMVILLVKLNWGELVERERERENRKQLISTRLVLEGKKAKEG